MIRFACICHTVLEVSDDFAGTSLQCPKCKRLVDVPTLSDLKSITEDGTYKIDELKLRQEPDRLADLQRAFARTHVDEQGNEIDLREHFGADSVPTLNEDGVIDVLNDEPPPPPKYDPETGELVRAMPLKNEPRKFDPNLIPLAKTVINYASGDAARQTSGWDIIPQLFQFQNIFVITVIIVVHLILQVMMIVLLAGIWIIVAGFFVLCFALIAHYGNVVDEIGPQQKDELPRPLRDLNWGEDIWGPFRQFMTALFFCYGLVVLRHRMSPMLSTAYAATIVMLGTVAFPAVFLTSTTSGTVLNLSPDRLLNVMRAIGLHYPICVLLWAVTAFFYYVGLLDSLNVIIGLFTGYNGGPTIFGFAYPAWFSYPLLFTAIVLMHGFCWYMGLQYRAHHEEFGWLLQRHHKKIETVRQPGGQIVASPTLAPPVAKAVPPPMATAVPPPPRNEYPQSHA